MDADFIRRQIRKIYCRFSSTNQSEID